MLDLFRETWFIYLSYLLSVIFFVLGIKKLSGPRTATSGNRYSMFAMLFAVVATLLHYKLINLEFLLSGFIIGSIIGIVVARSVPLTSMPETIAIFNGFGGIASALIAFSEFYVNTSRQLVGQYFTSITIILSILIGTLTFWGSLIAFGKLKGILPSRPVFVFISKPLNILALIGIIYLSYLICTSYSFQMNYLLIIILLSTFLGLSLVLPIGGGDMPVVVSLLNSYSGIAVLMTGFVLSNYVLIVVGALVGASGIILTSTMCKAMNRSLFNVLFGGFSASVSNSQGDHSIEGTIKTSTSNDLAALLDISELIIFVPGYGMAIAQAQHIVRKICIELEKYNKKFCFAIHPVAGRMPGHMNILLAEAGIEYDKLYDLEKANEYFSQSNLVIVVGANDVVNPAARTNKSSPIYGMPILNADESDNVVVLKRSIKNLGYAGVENDLFYKENTTILLGDAKQSLEDALQIWNNF